MQGGMGRERGAGGAGFVGMVLAAGLGTRLRPFTEHIPKPLFPVFDQTLLELAVRALVSGGIREVVVNAYHFPEQIERALAEIAGRHPGVVFHLSIEEQLMGTGGGIARARRFFHDADVVVVNGDLVAAWDVEGLCRLHRERGGAVTLEAESGERYPELRTTLVDSSGLVRSIGTEGLRGGEWGVFSGMYVLSPEAYGLLAEEPGSVVSGAIRPLVEQGRVYGRMRSFAWCDLGTWERVGGLVREVLSGASCWEALRREAPGVFVLGEGEGRGSSYVGPGAWIEGEVGSGSVVGMRGHVEPGVRVENCVVLPGCSVDRSMHGVIVGEGWNHALP